MEDGAGDAVTPCPTCRDPLLVEYEELQGGYICSGCGVVLSQLMISELPSTASDARKGIQVGGSYVGAEAGAMPGLSQDARAGRTISCNASARFRRRRRIHRLCQQLGLADSATDEALNLSLSVQSKSWTGDVASVYTVCRRRGRDVTFSDVCAAACSSRRQTGRCLRRIHAGGVAASDPRRFVKRALAVLRCAFDEEKQAMALLQFMTPRISSKQPHVNAFAAVVIVASATKSVPELSVIADKLAVRPRLLQQRISELKRALLMIARTLPLGVVLSVGNLHLYLNLILNHIPLLADLQAATATPPQDTIVAEYHDAVAKFGTRMDSSPPVVVSDDASASDLDSMSDDEAMQYIRSEMEVSEQILLHRQLGR